MSLSDQIIEFQKSFLTSVPQEVLAKMMKATEDLAATGIAERAPKVGDTLAEFSLPNQTGATVTLSDLTAKGPVIITFYRGGWCPYCNLELKAYQSVLDEINQAGATLVAITPELPDTSLSTIEKNEIEFQVLSDVNADYAKQLGVVFSLADELRPIYDQFGIELEKYNGEGQFDLPLAATFVVDEQGVIASAFVDADYTKRQEPAEALAAVKSLATA